ncbi:hypothetical protein [Streptomyces europaeiscabiei]|uniref:hypothetical protein n=1 Tax=Streptomyces europaeiscabiei TaxID=146819 RepID=UPI002E2D4D08|nr:hypothetical protein [Streptomyces europaeiscabiei]
MLAILCDAGRLRPRGAGTVLAVAALGHAAFFGAVTATAYAGRALYDPTAPVWVLLAAGVLITGTAAVLVLARAAPARRVPDPGPDAGKTLLVERTGG